jgi:hypothetical protein
MVLNLEGRGREAAFGASPPKRMIASWSDPGMGPTEYKGAARVFRAMAGSPRFVQTHLNQRRSQCHAAAFSIPQKHHEQTGPGRSSGSLSRDTTVPARFADADGRANDRCRAPDLPYSGGVEGVVDDGFADVDQLAAHPGIEDRTPVLAGLDNADHGGQQLAHVGGATDFLQDTGVGDA